ncbi:DUF6562 domain-containing protein [Bacteroides sp. 3_1_13]|uniref:DUF6562 domain-containing protein n=1 Tax=Bacteroides sp. 3_1_13 TaxID=457389 RepID=UPI000672220D|nr:DUF6562 domain-containing protein [Bacteroides sp. 3_1_13]KMW82566.1 hypothetical protein HMPREF9009_00153 [Bacteroides sp. 3_1_13]
MKNIFFNIFLFCSLGLLTACSEDDDKISTGIDANEVRLSALFPEKMSETRVDASSHKLRCILEIYRKENNQLAYREEIATTPDALAGKLSFAFEMEAGTYNCLIWADYIDANASQLDAGGNAKTTRYADKYFDTSDLTAVSMKNPLELVNNDACDAFFYSGEMQKNDGEGLAMEISLARPFSKISIREENQREFNLLKELKTIFPVATTFNVATGMVAGTPVQQEHHVTDFKPEVMAERTLLSFYTFANSETQKLGSVSLTFTTGIEAIPEQTVNIPDNLIPIVRNRHVKVSAAMMQETPEPEIDFNITYDIDVADWDVADMTVIAQQGKVKVGDFFYKDGTTSSNYVADADNPCIGVVFAVAHSNGAAALDSPENYPGTALADLETINGWVVAAYDFRDGTNDANLKPRKSADVVIPEGLKGDMNDIQGFLKTELLKQQTLSDYPIAEIIVNYQKDEITKAPANTSGWYWGAVKQYDALAKAYATASGGQLTESLVVRNSLQVLANAGVGELFPVGGNERRHWYSTATDKKSKGRWAGFVCFGVETNDYGGIEDDWWPVTNSGNARAILTF